MSHTQLNPKGMSQVVEGRRYTVDTSTLIADNVYWDGNNFDRGGRNTFLFRTRKGAYFSAHLTMWSGEQDTLRPLEEAEARELYESLREHYVPCEEAFPTAKVEEA